VKQELNAQDQINNLLSNELTISSLALKFYIIFEQTLISEQKIYIRMRPLLSNRNFAAEQKFALET
jgi:hypothetical protein